MPNCRPLYSNLYKNTHRFGALIRHVCQLMLAITLASASSFANAAEAGRVVFVVGAVHADGKPLVLNQAVAEGDLIVTGADGYVYLKTIDQGFLILRQNTQAKIVAYYIDAQQPGNSRVKLELLSGVARSISGAGVKQSRQNFRFNTPVAAIGVRGTDFTVFTDQNTTRIAVISGGIVISPFAGACQPEGNGPCGGSHSRELFANQPDQLLEVNKGQAIPQLLRGATLAPDGTAPARSDEPVAKLNSGTSSSLSTANVNMDVNKDAALQKTITALVVPPPVVVPAPSQIIWGRWQPILDQAANLNLLNAMGSNTHLIAISGPYALLREKNADWQIPHEGSIGFALQQSEAYIFDELHNKQSLAQIENGKLNIDLVKAHFTTSFDLVSFDLVGGAERFALQAQGSVTANGFIYGDSQFSRPTNMLVNGVLGAEKSDAAAYLFNSRLDQTRSATGATYWTRNQ